MSIDKTAWGDGPWQDEPDDEQYQLDGYDCRIRRMEHTGHLNGYVRIPKEHPWFEQDYGDLPLEVHGGLTFAAHGWFDTPDRAAAEWWIGFDCHHLHDFAPAYALRMAALGVPDLATQITGLDTTYKTAEYVRGEIASLVAQIKAAEGAAS